jgi:hypothetical protein
MRALRVITPVSTGCCTRMWGAFLETVKRWEGGIQADGACRILREWCQTPRKDNAPPLNQPGSVCPAARKYLA